MRAASTRGSEQKCRINAASKGALPRRYVEVQSGLNPSCRFQLYRPGPHSQAAGSLARNCAGARMIGPRDCSTELADRSRSDRSTEGGFACLQRVQMDATSGLEWKVEPKAHKHSSESIFVAGIMPLGFVCVAAIGGEQLEPNIPIELRGVNPAANIR